MSRPVRALSDLATLRALGHPRRRRILEHLTRHGPATSATLARALDLNTGATSYHLRELAAHGFVAELPERATGRERWWRAVPADLRFPPRGEQDPQTRAVVDEMNRLAFADDLAEYAAAQLAATGEWVDGFPFSRGTIQVSVSQLAAFFEEYVALLNRYQQPPGTPGTRPVLTRFLAFPAPPAEAGEPA